MHDAITQAARAFGRARTKDGQRPAELHLTESDLACLLLAAAEVAAARVELAMLGAAVGSPG